uniref:Uncharacterized protein n=1 Tax=Kalanchoe fedtschenkoi TaxID=63787 RepID=A0A7N0TFB4_KALFE
MGNCVRHCSQSRAQKQGDGIRRAEFGEEMKSTAPTACKDKDGERVVRVKVVVTRNELEQILRHYNNHSSSSSSSRRDGITTDDRQMWIINKLGVGERCWRTTTHQGDYNEGDWKPDLETIPEAEE